ncbi:C-C motif chemokine 24-like [Carassius auratus]|uniref:C-C motif chemokine 24-like n=1 Tax=Carassius auratus TaxID=7957 RepID=A0A6P6J9A0_CARAU|nr:C-C motif chemokine 24-like [Carassius auratus]
METRRTLMRSLAVAVVIAYVIWTTTAEEQKLDTPCCTQVSRAKLTDPILNFRLQPESLPCVRAVIFETERGEFCRDPRQPWVKEKVKNLRAQRNKPLTSTAAPTSSISDQTHVGGATRN